MMHDEIAFSFCVLLSTDGQGPLHHGVCSSWLNNINEGDMVPCYIQRHGTFTVTISMVTHILLEH